jgi:hypothetical protein
MSRVEVVQFLTNFAGRDGVSVWCPELDDWKPARQVFDVVAPGPLKEPELPPPLPLDPNRRTNFLARYWRGEYSLGVSYWCFGLLGNIAVACALVGIAGLFTGGDYQPQAIFASLASIWLVSSTYVVWQTVGVWRSANRHAVRRRAAGKRAGWAIAAKVAAALGFLSSLSAFVTTGWPQLAEASRMAFLDDPGIPPYSIRVMRDGTEAEISGGFKYGLTKDFAKTLWASHQIKVVHLNSIGGRIGEAIKLNSLLKAQGVDTYVSSGCYSACTIAFAAGQKRILRNGAILGFHAPRFPGLTNDDLQSAALEQKQIFGQAGFDKAFVDEALATPSSDMWKPSAEILSAANVITGLSDGTDFAISGFGPVAGKDQMAAVLVRRLPVLQSIKDRYPEVYAEIVSNYYGGFVIGKTEAEVTIATRTRFLSLIAKLRPMADDDVLADIGSLYADQIAALGMKSPALCYQYASGVTEKDNFSDQVPAPLLARENEIQKRVVETARTRQGVPAAVVTDLWKKVGMQLSTKGIGDAQFKLLTSSTIKAARYGEFCSVSVAFYREIARLPQQEAAILMRSILTNK